MKTPDDDMTGDMFKRLRKRRLLYGEANARSGDPDTSKAAAEGVEGELAGRLQREIHETLLAQGIGLTAREIGHCLRTELGSITPRMIALESKGFIERTSEKRICKFTGRGRAGIVWRLK